MTLPIELVKEIKRINLSLKLEELSLLICNDLFNRRFKDKINFVPIYKKELLSIYTIDDIRLALRKLTSKSILLCDNKKIKGEKSYYYKISEVYSEFENYKPQTIKAKKIMKREIKKTDNYIYNLPPFLKAMRLQIVNLKWDFNKLNNYVDSYIPTDKELLVKKTSDIIKYSKEAKEAMKYAIENLKNGHFKFHRDNTSNRLHTNITNMKTDLFKLVDNKLIEIDIRNSQPYFLSILLNKLINIKVWSNMNKEGYNIDNEEIMTRFPFSNTITPSVNLTIRSVIQPFIHTILQYNTGLEYILSSHKLKSEILRFETVVLSGKFYELFMTKFNMSRDEVKILMFEILFSQNKSYRKEKAIFIQEFPIINQVIEKIKEENHNTLAILLQSIESYIMIDVVCQRLVMNHAIIPITKHDSVAVDPSQAEEVYNIMKGVFLEKCGSVPELTIKPLN